MLYLFPDTVSVRSRRVTWHHRGPLNSQESFFRHSALLSFLSPPLNEFAILRLYNLPVSFRIEEDR